MAFLDLAEGILEEFSGAQGAGGIAPYREFNARNGYHPCWTDSEKYATAKAEHKCPKCRKPMEGDRVHCKNCVTATVECRKRRRTRLRADGLCACGAERDCEKTRCARCRAKQREYTARFKAKIGTTHCIDCGKPRDGTQSRCGECRKNRAAYRAQYWTK